MKKLVSAIILVSWIVVLFGFTAIQIIAAVTPVSTIFPSGIYYIRNQHSGLYMDVHNLGTANNTPVEQYYYNGGENQRFQVYSTMTSGVYEIIPLHAQNMRLDICNASPEDNTPLEIYQANATAAQRFKIVPTGNGDNSFKIMTKGTDFTKCLSVANDAMGFASIVQRPYENNGNADSDHWYFEDVTLNEKTLVSLSKGQSKTFEFTVPDDMYYAVETLKHNNVEHDTQLTINNLSTGNAYDDDHGLSLFSLIGFNNQGGRNISITVNFYDPEEAGTFYLQIRKQRAVYYGFDYGDWDINTLSDLTVPYNSFSNLYQSYKFESGEIDRFLELDERGYSRYNSEIVFFSGHGSESGTISINNDVSLSLTQLTDMNNVRLAVWSSCYSAYEENSHGTSFVYKSIDAGASAAIGFPDTISVTSSRSFTDDLFEKLAAGYTIKNAAEYAADQLIWPFDNVKDYVVAGAGFYTLATPVFTKSLPSNPFQNNLMNNYNDLLTRDYAVYDNGNVNRYYMTINGILTNQFVDIPKNISMQNYATQNYTVGSNVTVLPILVDYDITDTETIENHLVYVIENNVATPILITYVTHTDETGATYCEAVCKNLNDGTYIDYGTINKVKEASNASVY